MHYAPQHHAALLKVNGVISAKLASFNIPE